MVGLLAFSGAGVAVAQGGLTANLALSGTLFNIKMSHLTGSGFSLFMDSDKKGENTLPVARLKFEQANASNLCLSTTLPDLPGVGEATLALKANGENTVDAQNLIVGATDIAGALKLTEPQVGIDTHQVNSAAPPGAWGLTSQSVEVRADDILATAIGASMLTVEGVSVTVKRGSDNAC